MKRIRFVTLMSLALLGAACDEEGPTKTEPSRLGKRGESCLNSSECSSSLACIRNVCTEADFKIATGAKVCHQVDCAEDADCCANVPAECANYAEDYARYCEPYEVADCYVAVTTYCTTNAECTEAGQSCNTATGYCTCTANPNYSPSNDVCYATCTPCTLVCTEERCVSQCTLDSQCYPGTCDTATGACIQCNTDTDCTGAGQECLDHVCTVPCKQNENCSIFYSCNAGSGECEYVGCTADHECQFAYTPTESNGKASLCVENERAGIEGQPDRLCRVPCVSDAECTGRQELCQNGSCVYMGCETDEECRSELGLFNRSTTETFTPKAVCREL